jgi:hypothetical protein
LVLQSNTFSTTWANDDSTETSGQAGYDGTTNAWLLAKTAANGRIGQVLTVSGSATFSIYAKAGTDSWVRLASSDAGVYAYFNLGTGAVGTTGGSTTAAITSVGNGWYRCSISGNASFTFFNIWVADADNDTSGASGNILIQSAQIETGDIATEPILTTTAAVSVGPVANVPRLDYLDSTCPRLILEGQRTNKITYSENQGPTGTNWYPSTTWTVTNNTVTSPSGYQDADTLTETTSTDFHSSYYNATIESSYTGTYTISAFAKYNGRLFVLNPFSTAAGRTYFNLQTGTVAQSGTGVTASIVNYGNGWYRCICTATYSAEIVIFEHMLASAVGTLNYTGNGTSGVHIWGCMAESGAYATSYIPTLAASATRGADACSKTGISSLIGQTEGTLFVEEYYDATVANNNGLDDVLIATTDGTTQNVIFILHYGSAGTSYGNVARFFIRAGNVNQMLIDSAPLTTGNYKIALAYKNNDVVAYINGVQVGTDTSVTVPTTSVVTLVDPITTNAATKTVNINQALLFKTRLTNAELASLTSL